MTEMCWVPCRRPARGSREGSFVSSFVRSLAALARHKDDSLQFKNGGVTSVVQNFFDFDFFDWLHIFHDTIGGSGLYLFPAALS